MTDHEEIMICAERYALGRRTYIVGSVVDYIGRRLNDMSDQCIKILTNDIESQDNYGDNCDKEKWMWLLDKLKAMKEE